MDELSSRAAPFQAILTAQRTVVRALFRARIPEWVHLDLTMGQLKTLMVLACQRATNISALAETLGVSKPTASILVEQLVQLGYAERTEDPEDRRRTLTTLTKAGGDLVERLRHDGPPGSLVRWLEMMAPDDLAALQRGMQALAAIVERDTAPVTPA